MYQGRLFIFGGYKHPNNDILVIDLSILKAILLFISKETMIWERPIPKGLECDFYSQTTSSIYKGKVYIFRESYKLKGILIYDLGMRKKYLSNFEIESNSFSSLKARGKTS